MMTGVALDMIVGDRMPRRVWALPSALMTASFPVEVWRQTRVPDSGASSFDCVVEPAL